MASTVSLKGIDEAIANLNYKNPQALKSKLVHAIRGFYQDESAVHSLAEIDAEALIRALWGTGHDHAAIKAKRKNLSSTKSSVNGDLKKLFKAGRNPDGVIIGRENIFVMSDEAKDKLLSSFGTDGTEGQAASLQQIAQSLNDIKKILAKPEVFEDGKGPQALATLANLRNTIQRLSQRIGTRQKESEASEAPEAPAKPAKHEAPFEQTKELKVASPGEDEAAPGSDDAAGEITEPHPEEAEAIAQEPEVPEGVEADGEAGLGHVSGGGHLEDPDLEQAEPTREPELPEVIVGDAVVDDAEGVDQILEAEEVPEESEAVESGAVEADAFEEDDLQEVLEAIELDEGDDDAHTSVEAEHVDEEDVEQVLDDLVADDDLEQVELEQEAQTAKEVELPEVIVDDAAVDDAEGVDQILEAEEVPEESEAVESGAVEADAFEEDDLQEVLEAIELDEGDDDGLASSETEVADQADGEAVLGHVSGGGDLEETASGEGKPVDVLEHLDAAPTTEEVGLPAGSLGEEAALDGDANTEKSRLLAEVFDGYLGTMERFYNQYLLIPAGNYRVGSTSPKREERLEQIVRVAPFYMGKFPVTNALFEVFVEKTGYVTTAEKAGYGTVYYGRLCKEVDDKTGAVRFRCNGTVQSKTVEGAFWYQPCGPGSTLHRKRNHPVVQVSLEDAMAFAAWTGKRLPTEDEWEAAARTEKAYVYPWGNAWQEIACNVEDSAIADTTPVDAFKEMTNGFAIVDTLGNVLEWTSDVLGSTENPTNSHKYHIVKGGSWISEKEVRLFSRFKVKADAPSNILGFRCVAH